MLILRLRESGEYRLREDSDFHTCIYELNLTPIIRDTIHEVNANLTLPSIIIIPDAFKSKKFVVVGNIWVEFQGSYSKDCEEYCHLRCGFMS
jgi:hypothetical protein